MNDKVVVILPVAGQGSRLRPLTNEIPKAMVRFNGKSLINYQLDIFDKLNLKDINFIGGYRADKLPDDRGRVFINKDYESTNMVYSLFTAEEIMTDKKDLLICYGDIIYQQDVLEKVLASNAPVNIVTDLKWKDLWSLRLENPLDDAESFKWNPITKKISELGKKTKSYEDVQGQYIGIIKIRADHVELFKKYYHLLDQNEKYDGQPFKNLYMTSFIQHLIDKGVEVCGVPINNGWLEFDTVSDIEFFEKMRIEGSLGKIINV